MPFKLKIKVATRLIGTYEIANDDDPQEYPAPGSPVPEHPTPVNVVQIFRDIGGDGCWYVHEEPGGWWGWDTRPCTVDPVLRIRTRADGKIRQVGYKVAAQQWEPAS